MKYYKGDRLRRCNAVYNFEVGGRGSGKSYDMAEFLLKEYFDHGKRFVRTVRDATYATGIDTYFDTVLRDMTEAGEIEEGYRITFFGGTEGEYIISKGKEDKEIFGKVLAISQEQKYKSSVFDASYEYMFFEEFIANSPIAYAYNSAEAEVRAFNSIVSTVFRHRTGKVFFIGNNYDINNPYFEYFGVDGTKLKLGEVVKFQATFAHDKKGKEIKAASVAVEYVPMAYQDYNEIPMMLRVPNNEMATTGEVTKSRQIAENTVKYIVENGEIVAFIVDRITMEGPQAGKSFYYRGNIFNDGYESLHDAKTSPRYHEYLMMVDYIGTCLVSQIPEPTDLTDERLIFVSTDAEARDIYRKYGHRLVQMPDRYMHCQLDIASEVGTDVNCMYFDCQMTEYNFVQDVLDQERQRAIARQYGQGKTPNTEDIKDYKYFCKERGVRGYSEERKHFYSQDDTGYISFRNSLLGDQFANGRKTNATFSPETPVASQRPSSGSWMNYDVDDRDMRREAQRAISKRANRTCEQMAGEIGQLEVMQNNLIAHGECPLGTDDFSNGWFYHLTMGRMSVDDFLDLPKKQRGKHYKAYEKLEKSWS